MSTGAVPWTQVLLGVPQWLKRARAQKLTRLDLLNRGFSSYEKSIPQVGPAINLQNLDLANEKSV
jgi:hypothetical protein